MLCGEVTNYTTTILFRTRFNWVNLKWERQTLAKDYYLTWTSQAAAPSFKVIRTESDQFIVPVDEPRATSHAGRERAVYDFISTSFQTNFGHSHPTIIQRIGQQLGEMPIASPKATFDLKDRVSERLLEKVDGRGIGKLFYTVSGAEAVENALKISRQFTARPIVLARRQSYHGATLGAMSVSGDWRGDAHLRFDDGTVRIPEPHDDPQLIQTRQIVEQTDPQKIAAVIVETISGVNGVIIPPQSWWDQLRILCDEFGILLICDEVLAGFCRTGPAFAFHHFGVMPDLICMSKGLTGGYIPGGAVWTSNRIAEKYEQDILSCGLTNYGHPLALAAIDAVLDIIDSADFDDNKRQLETIFESFLFKLAKKDYVRDIRCKGLLMAIELDFKAPVWQEFFESGLYLYSKENMIVLAPPLTSKPSRLAAAIECFEQVIQRNALKING